MDQKYSCVGQEDLGKKSRLPSSKVTPRQVVRRGQFAPPKQHAPFQTLWKKNPLHLHSMERRERGFMKPPRGTYPKKIEITHSLLSSRGREEESCVRKKVLRPLSPSSPPRIEGRCSGRFFSVSPDVPSSSSWKEWDLGGAYASSSSHFSWP